MKKTKKLAGAEKFGVVVVVDPSISEEIKFKKKLEEAKKHGPFIRKKTKSEDKIDG
jgi:hypothetical protein